MSDHSDWLRSLVAEAVPKLENLGAGDTATRPEPTAWSPRELLGHLVDSAANNHQRFVRARFQDDLVFPGYDQDAWVEAQAYAQAPWDELVVLWKAYNLHLARVMDQVPDHVRHRAHARHNLDAISWLPVAADRPATLAELMEDYVAHLEHHLESLIGAKAFR